VPSEHHTWLSEVVAEVSMDAGVMLQLIGLNELEHVKKHTRAVSLLGLKKEPRNGRMCKNDLKIQTKKPDFTLVENAKDSSDRQVLPTMYKLLKLCKK
jgi:hypothetical protein